MIRTATACLAAAALLSCAGVAVDATPQPGVDLGRYASFYLAPPATPHPVVGETLDAEIPRILEKKGYRSATRSEADMVVVYRGQGEEQLRRVNAADPDSDYYVMQSYIAGTLEIDVFDGHSRQVLWEGVGHVDLRERSDAPEAAARAAKAILAEFPDAP